MLYVQMYTLTVSAMAAILLIITIFLQLFECTIPQPLGMLEAFVYEEEEYPVVCFGVKET